MEECDALEAEQLFGQTRSQPPAAEGRIVREVCQHVRHLAERVTPPTADWEDRVASPPGGRGEAGGPSPRRTRAVAHAEEEQGQGHEGQGRGKGRAEGHSGKR